MNIGAAAKMSGVPAKTIRYYEEVGLIPPASRTAAGYRQYDETDVQILRFVERARSLGFTMDDVSKLLGLWADKDRRSGEVKALAARHIDAIEVKIRELQAMREALHHLVDRCQGDDRPECPIIDGLAEPRASNADPLTTRD